MKKGLLSITSICLAACFIGACSTPGKNTTDEYDFLNKMLNLNYSQLEITITETVNENTSLNSEYVITYSESMIKVEYSVERFNEVGLDNPSTELKTTLSGLAVIISGIVSVVGDDVDINANIAKVGLTFKKEYFENDVLSDGNFEADVKKVDSFIGSHVVFSDMKVVATYGEAFNNINITCTSETENKVNFTYVFKI